MEARAAARLWALTRGPEGIRGSLWRPLAAALLVLMAVWSLAVAVAAPSPREAPRGSLSRPADPVLLPAPMVVETAAAVRATLDNVVRHAGGNARVFILVEDGGDAVTVTIRDDGVGMDPDRERGAEAEGRLGLARSIRGRVVDLGGTVRITTASARERWWSCMCHAPWTSCSCTTGWSSRATRGRRGSTTTSTDDREPGHSPGG